MVPGGVGVKSSNPRWALIALRRSFVWKGRARRAESWWYMALFFALFTLLVVIDYALIATDDGADNESWYNPLAFSIIMIGLVPGVSCAIRRLHDLGRSGQWYLLVFATLPLGIPGSALLANNDDGTGFFVFLVVPALSGALTLLYWFLQRGTIGENRYGPDPLMVD
jgi:uncharacterized membrane protein YhaH (DUF805 family)